MTLFIRYFVSFKNYKNNYISNISDIGPSIIIGF